MITGRLGGADANTRDPLREPNKDFLRNFAKPAGSRVFMLRVEAITSGEA